VVRLGRPCGAFEAPVDSLKREMSQPMVAQPAATPTAADGTRIVLLTLATGQFLMTLDSSVMNVSIATVASDLGTTVSGIQTAITFYTLVMATLMLTGGKIGANIGRRKAFAIGCVIYGLGSFITAIAPNLTVLLFGWSFLEGVGAALIMPAIVALVATNVPPPGRPSAYGLIAAAGAIAVAAGPLIGGAVTTYASWRLVFLGEVVIAGGILVLARRIHDVPPTERPRLDIVGSILSVLGLGLTVYGVLKSGVWGWITPKQGAPELFGLSPVAWLLVAGLLILRGLFAWESRLERTGGDPLVRPSLFRYRQLVGGLTMFMFQYLTQAGIFSPFPSSCRWCSSCRRSTRACGWCRCRWPCWSRHWACRACGQRPRRDAWCRPASGSCWRPPPC